MTNAAINQGQWSDNAEQKLRITADTNGIIQIAAFGIHPNYFKVAAGKKADLKAVADSFRIKTNAFYKTYEVKDLHATPRQLKQNLNKGSLTFADGDRIARNNSSSFLQILSEGYGAVKSLLTTTELPEKVYLNNKKDQVALHAPGLVTGTVEAAAKAITDITQLASLVYDLASEQKNRQDIYEGLKALKDQIKDNPAELFSLLGKIMLEEATGNTSENWSKATKPDTDKGEKAHLLSKGAVRTVTTVLASGKLLAKLPEMTKKLSEKMSRVKKAGKVFNNAKELFEDIYKNRYKIRQVLDLPEGKAYAGKYFKNIVKKGNFEKWYANTFKKYHLNEPLNFEVHHVIPVKVLEKNPKLQELLLWAEKNGKKFDFNGLDNGMPLQKKRLKYEQTGHANHPDYDGVIEQKINNILNQYTPVQYEDAFEEIKHLINTTKNKLEVEVLLGNKDVNQIIYF